MSEDKAQTIDPLVFWGVVEIMGHNRIAGRISEQEIAGQKFVRVDIPEIKGKQQASTQFIGPSSIYRVQPIEESLTRQIASRIDAMPVSVWDAEKFVDLKRGSDVQVSIDEQENSKRISQLLQSEIED